MEKQITINDVAIAAGVSKGTVDRVLHDRPEVSRKTYEKVMRVVEELGFTPNVNASLLAHAKPRLILCILPEYAHGEIWEFWEKGIDDTREYAARYGISISSLHFDQYDKSSFDQVCDKALSMNPSGVIMAPMFSVGAIRFSKSLKSAGIPYIYIDSKPDDDSYMSFYGMPMYQSGYLAGQILTTRRESRINEIVNVRIIRDSKNLSDPTLMRRIGFCDYVSEHLSGCSVSEVHINPRSSEDTARVLDEALLPRLKKGEVYLVMFNSRIHLVASYLSRRGIQGGCHCVGFDYLAKNIDALRSGFIESIVAQHCDTQMSRAIHALSDLLVFGKQPDIRDHYTQMDILNNLNCDYYI